MNEPVRFIGKFITGKEQELFTYDTDENNPVKVGSFHHAWKRGKDGLNFQGIARVQELLGEENDNRK